MSSHGEGVKAGSCVSVGSLVLPASLSPIHGQQPLAGEALKRLSESLPQQVQMSASPDAFGDSSWNDVGLQLAGGSRLFHNLCQQLQTRVLICTCVD